MVEEVGRCGSSLHGAVGKWRATRWWWIGDNARRTFAKCLGSTWRGFWWILVVVFEEAGEFHKGKGGARVLEVTWTWRNAVGEPWMGWGAWVKAH